MGIVTIGGGDQFVAVTDDDMVLLMGNSWLWCEGPRGDCGWGRSGVEMALDEVADFIGLGEDANIRPFVHVRLLKVYDDQFATALRYLQRNLVGR